MNHLLPDLSVDIQIGMFVCLFCLFVFSCVVCCNLMKYKKKLRKAECEFESQQKLFSETLEQKTVSEYNHQFLQKISIQLLGLIRLTIHSDLKRKQKLLSWIIDFSNEREATSALLSWDDLYIMIDLLYDKFYTNLNEKYGELLADKEIQQCCLLRANFSTVEISIIMQQSMQTIYQRKTSIRNKINVGEKEDIVVFLEH